MSLLRPAPEVRPADELLVRIEPMRRRHVRSVLRIEDRVYPRPWSASVFHTELGYNDGSRCYLVARVDRHLVGYGGFLMAVDDAHITNIAVDPRWHRHKIATRLLLTLAREAQASGATHLTLEVRVSNVAAQALYRRFGFAPAGVRTKYYENVEDAIIMWAHDIDQPAYAERLAAIEATVPGRTVRERVR